MDILLDVKRIVDYSQIERHYKIHGAEPILLNIKLEVQSKDRIALEWKKRCW